MDDLIQLQFSIQNLQTGNHLKNLIAKVTLINTNYGAIYNLGSTKNLYGISVNAVRAFDRSSRDANIQTNDIANSSGNYWQQEQQQRR